MVKHDLICLGRGLYFESGAGESQRGLGRLEHRLVGNGGVEKEARGQRGMQSARRLILCGDIIKESQSHS